MSKLFTNTFAIRANALKPKQIKRKLLIVEELPPNALVYYDPYPVWTK